MNVPPPMMPGMPPMGMPGMMPGMPHVPMPGVVPPPPRIPKRPPPIEPCQTLYIRNLPETRSLKPLENGLRAIFSQFGEVMAIRMKRNIKARGQAFVTFKDKESATKALKEVQGFPISGRPMDIQYARERSDKAAELEGDAVLEEHKRKRIEEKATRGKEPREEVKVDAAAVAAVYGPGYYYGAAMPEDLLPANNILFVQNLPPESNEALVASLFSQFAGFREVRLVPTRKDIAFVEFETEMQAGVAKSHVNGREVKPGSDKKFKVTYAKK